MDEERIVKQYADMVYKIAFRYVRNVPDAEDVFSDTFLAYFLKKRAFESEEHRKAWLIRVTINCAKKLLKKKNEWVELPDYEPAAEDAVKPEEHLDLQQAIAQLRPAYREVICLFYQNNLSIKEIAQVLDRNENTVKIHLARGREQLRKFLEE